MIPKKNKTILFYLVSDNNLENRASELLKIISESSVNVDKINLVIYIDGKSAPMLLVKDAGKKLNANKVYEETNSTKGDKISEIVDYVIKTYPAEETGLILWSHGTSWLPADNLTYSRSFGYDKGEEGDIKDIANHLKFKFDYIIFDACYMGSIEVCSEFASKAKYIVASPSVVPGAGIILPQSIEYLTAESSIENRLKRLCNNYFEHYAMTKEDISISLVCTNHMRKLAEFINTHPAFFFMSAIETIQSFSIREKAIFFDFYSVLKSRTECF